MSKKTSQKAVEKLLKKTKYVSPRSLQRFNTVKLIYNDILHGYTQSMLLDKVQSGGYKEQGGASYKGTNAYEIIKETRDMLAYDFEQDKPYLKQILYNKLNDIYTDCRDADDRYNAIQALNAIAKITGVAESASKINIESKGDIKISFGFNDEDDDEEEEKVEQDDELEV